MEPVAAWYVGNVLIGTPPPENGVPGRVAFKTGTSYGYRDAWSVGFDGRYTIGVWVGRPDGAPVPGLVGRMAAAPILFDAFARLADAARALPRAPSGVLVTTSAKLPPPLKFFQPGERGGAGEAKLHILFPPDGARLDLTAAADEKPAPVPLKITGGVAPLTILVNGVPASAQTAGEAFLSAAGPGFARVTVIDGSGAADSVMVRLDDGAAATASGRPRSIRPARPAPAPVPERGFRRQAFSLWSARFANRERHDYEQQRGAADASKPGLGWLRFRRWCCVFRPTLCAGSSFWCGRRARGRPRRPGAVWRRSRIVLAVIIASMFLFDTKAIELARRLPLWLHDFADEITNYGRSSTFLYPLRNCASRARGRDVAVR